MECAQCGRQIPKGRGILLVRRDGTLVYFCSGACRKNFELGRKKVKRVKRVRKKE